MKADRAELRRLLASLPYRPPKRVENGAAVDDVASSDSADDELLDHEREARLQAAKAALGRAVAGLAPEDALIVRLHFFEGFSIADVARHVDIPQKPLYVRMKRLLDTLHKDLASQGIGPDDCDWRVLRGPDRGNAARRPSNISEEGADARAAAKPRSNTDETNGSD